MNKTIFYEAIYASCNNIIARRKSIVLPIILIVIAIVLPFISSAILNGPQYDDINSTVIIVAMATAVAGGVWLLGRVIGKGAPYHKDRGVFLTTTILNFDRSRRSEIINAIGSKDVSKLLAIPTCEVSALCLMISHLPDHSFAAVQLFEYAELEYRELCSVTIMNKQ